MSRHKHNRSHFAPDHDYQRYGEQVEAAFDAAIRRTRVSALLTATVMLFTFVAVSIVLWVGGHDVPAGRISGGQLSAFVFYALLLDEATSSLDAESERLVQDACRSGPLTAMGATKSRRRPALLRGRSGLCYGADVLDRLRNLFRSPPAEPAPPADEFTQAIKAYAKGLSSTQGRDIDSAPIDEQAGLVLFDISLRALTASGHLAQVNDVDEQIALLMFAMLASSPLVQHLRKEGHDIQHNSVFGVAAAAFTSNLDSAARAQTVELSAGLFKRFIEQAQKKDQFENWLEMNRHMIWGLVVSDKPELRQALAGHYIALRAAVAQLR